jgi:hypothetical protein
MRLATFVHRKEESMKRAKVSKAKVSKDETKTKPDPIIIRVRINSGNPEPIRMLQASKEPELGEIFRGVPTRFKTNLFRKTFRVESISVEKGKNVFHCTTDVMGSAR